MDEMRCSIPLSKLAQNFRDAVVACRKLYQQCIWIDWLCIIQDPPFDWLKGLALMESVYYNS